jgi:glucan-binding YG repeat protein
MSQPNKWSTTMKFLGVCLTVAFFFFVVSVLTKKDDIASTTAAASTTQARPTTADDDDKVGPMISMLWYHNTCADVLYPSEISRFKQTVSYASPSTVRAGQRVIENGLAMWGSEERYCQMLTAWIKLELPEVGRRLKK